MATRSYGDGIAIYPHPTPDHRSSTALGEVFINGPPGGDGSAGTSEVDG
jgi:hypothetical protein